MERVLFKNGDDALIYNDATHDLVWIDDDTVTYIEPTNSLTERMKTISYFGEFVSIEALSYVIRKLKGQI